MKEHLSDLVRQAVRSLAGEKVPVASLPLPAVEMTKDRAFGDYSTNAALVLASRFRTRPRELAERLAARLLDLDRGRLLAKAEVAGPGFVNMTMALPFWSALLDSVLREGPSYADSRLGEGRKVQVEFVSANPTGPLHVGHGRGAAVGDALANILAATGWQVQREYYINDAGNQINTLGLSVFARYRELLGEKVEFSEDWYKGSYIVDIAKNLAKKHGRRHLEADPAAALSEISLHAASLIFSDIRDDLEQFGVRFDAWFSEQSLFESGEVERTLEDLRQAGHLYRHEEALWFRSTPMGDDKDRVVVKADGSYTYFASDLAYHRNKYARGFSRVIDIWGADHHGYIARMKAGVEALGRKKEDLAVLLIQLVALRREGKPVAMSTRAGEFDTLRQVREEVGKDAARFIFLTRKADSKLDFDLTVAKAKSNDNPVYYVQYAHARICSILRKAAEEGHPLPRGGEGMDLSLLVLPEEKDLLRHLAALPEVIEGASEALEPHRLTGYLREAATTLHNFYHHHRVLSEDPALTKARLALMIAVRTALARALSLMGVSAPERM